MDIVEIDEKTIFGLSVRTSNADEMNQEMAKIGKLWQKFDSEVDVDYQGGERVYGVYYNYVSDANDKFDVLAGCEKDNNSLDSVVIQKGKYLVFKCQAETPDDPARAKVVIETWGKVWAYFSDEVSKFKRAYKTDFEYYKNQKEIEIYISVV